MKVQLLFFDGCPHWTTMEEHLLEALVVTDKAEAIERCVVETQETADAYRFAGSPLIRLDGRDPFPSSPGEFGLTCRVYTTPEGPAGAPTVEQLVAAIRQVSAN